MSLKRKNNIQLGGGDQEMAQWLKSLFPGIKLLIYNALYVPSEFLAMLMLVPGTLMFKQLCCQWSLALQVISDWRIAKWVSTTKGAAPANTVTPKLYENHDQGFNPWASIRCTLQQAWSTLQLGYMWAYLECNFLSQTHVKTSKPKIYSKHHYVSVCEHSNLICSSL